MAETPLSGTGPDRAGREKMLAAIFAQLVLQQTNMAMMLMGKVPHPQTGERVHDLEGAQMFIDQLDMLDAKTKGNLDKDEEKLLRQSLMSVRLAFVEAVRSPGTPAPAASPASPAPSAAASSAPEDKSRSASEPATAPEGESKVKFSKKY